MRQKCSFPLYSTFTYTHTHIHTCTFLQAIFDLSNCFRNIVWWQNGSHWKPFLSESVSIRTLALSLAPLHFPRVSLWVYLSGLRPWFFHSNIIQQSIIAKMTSSPSLNSFFTHSYKFPWQYLFSSQISSLLSVLQVSHFPFVSLCLVLQHLYHSFFIASTLFFLSLNPKQQFVEGNRLK